MTWKKKSNLRRITPFFLIWFGSDLIQIVHIHVYTAKYTYHSSTSTMQTCTSVVPRIPWSLGPLFLALNTGGAPHRGAGPVPRQGNMAFQRCLRKFGLAEHMELEVKLVMPKLDERFASGMKGDKILFVKHSICMLKLVCSMYVYKNIHAHIANKLWCKWQES